MQPNAFDRFRALGYTRLVPIIPPDAPVSPKSSLARGTGRTDPRGKAVGVRGSDGLWHGFDWVHSETDDRDIERWKAMEAGVGIKTGGPDNIIGIDADTMDSASARIIRDTIEERLGRLPVRIGRYPKALYLCRTSEPYRYTRIEFGARDERGALSDRVEILSEGRQFVADGIHPATRAPYAWPRGETPLADLATFTPDQIDGLLRALAGLLPAAGELVREGSSAQVDQNSLKGAPDMVRKAIAALPNTSALFPSREDFLEVGYALKGALQDDVALALDLFQDWAARWTDGANDPRIVETEFQRMRAPYRVGAPWLYEQAALHAPAAFSKADVWFENLDEMENPFAQIFQNSFKNDSTTGAELGPEAAAAAMAAAIRPSPYAFPDPAAIPRRRWLYGSHYIASFVSATVAPSGVGKTSLLIAEFLAMASGKPILGVQPAGALRCWYWNGEDPLEELERRVAATMQHYGLTREDVGDRLFLDTGRNMEIVLATTTRGGTTICAPVERALRGAIEGLKLDVVGADPFVSTHRVPENDNGAIDLVAKRWARIADQTGTAVALVHHVRKLNGGETTVEDARGASALIAAARPTRALSRMSKAEALKLGAGADYRRLFRIADDKNNLAPIGDDAAAWFAMVSVPLGNGGGDALDAALQGDRVGVVTRHTLATITPESTDREALALELVRAGEWRRDVRAGDAWIGVPLGQALGLDYADDDEKAILKRTVADWIKRGVLREETRRDAARHPRVYVVAGAAATPPADKAPDLFG